MEGITLETIGYAILGGLFFGSTFYTYLFDWGYLLVGISILAILFLCQKKYSEFKILLYALLIGFIVVIIILCLLSIILVLINY